MSKMTLYDNFRMISEAVAAGQSDEMIKKLTSDKFVKEFVNYVYNPHIKWLVDTVPLYTPNRDSDEIMILRLKQEWHRIGIFLSTGSYVNMKQKRREQLFEEILSVIHPYDAKLMISAMNRKLPFENLTKRFFEKQYPEYKEMWKNG